MLVGAHSGATPGCVSTRGHQSGGTRDYAAQVDVYRRKPTLAAVPGTSKHGWGVAVDLCGGIEDFGSPAHRWMQANAPAYGWVHPAWAGPTGSRPEPWHWEYTR